MNDFGFPHSFSVAEFQSSNQRIILEGFEGLENLNRATLLGFDPTQPDAYADIELETGFPEAEEAEPKVAQARLSAMLQNLGLAFQVLKEDDPACIFQYTYDDGAIIQLRLVERADGVKIPVFTSIEEDDQGNAIESIELLSYDAAAQTKQEYESDDGEEVASLFEDGTVSLNGVFLGVIGAARGLAPEDIKDMLAVHREIQALDTVLPDEAFNRLRQKLASAILPGFQLVQGFRARRFSKAAEEYLLGLKQFIDKHNLDAEQVSGLLQDEQIQRLAALDGQLRKRRRVATVGLTAMSACVTIASGVLGATLGSSPRYNILSSSMIEETLLGAGLGAMLSLEQVSKFRRKGRGVKGFLNEVDTSGLPINDQLYQEALLATTYLNLLRII